MEDWNNYPSRASAGRMIDADSDKDNLKKLSDGIENALKELLVSLLYRSSTHCKQLFSYPGAGSCCYSTGNMEEEGRHLIRVK